MAKLTDAQMATLARGAQHPSGFISPAPKTPVPMALTAAQKLVAQGLVEQVPCFHDEPFYLRDEGTGDFIGFRVTAAGFEALGIDGSEWPAYATQDAEADAPAPVADMPDEPYEPNGSVEFGEPEPDASGIEGSVPAGDEAADQPLVSATDLAASMVAKPTSLRDAAAAVVAGWASISDDGTLDPIEVMGPLVAALRAALPAAKAAKPAGEPGEPRSGSKAALVIGLLQRPGGATAAQVEEATGWTNTSTRGFISSLRIKRGLAVGSRKEGGTSRYWIGDAAAPAAIEAPEPAAKATQEDPAF